MASTTLTLYSGLQVNIPPDQQNTIAEWDRFVAANRTSAIAHRTLAGLLENAKIPVVAAAEFREAGRSFKNLSQFRAAYECFKRSHELQNSEIINIEFAYLCNTLGFKEKASQHFYWIADFYFRSGDFVAADLYFGEILRLNPENLDISSKKAMCVFKCTHPIDVAERAKNAAALLYPLTKSLDSKKRALGYLYIGIFFKHIDNHLAFDNILLSIWHALDVKDFDMVQSALKELKELQPNNRSLELIENFFGCFAIAESEGSDKNAAIKICDEFFKLYNLPLILKLKARLLAKNGIQNFETYNDYLNLLPKDHKDKKKVFFIGSVEPKGQVQHPNADARLTNTIIRAINEKISWSQWPAYISNILAKEFNLPYTYYFKYSIRLGENSKKVGESDHLLFFGMFNLQIFDFQRMLKASDESLLSVRDSAGNTLAHVAACFGLHLRLQAVLTKAALRGELEELINSRNHQGTNPLGMLFLRTDVGTDVIAKIAEIFIKESAFKVNSYLNNQQGMDYRSEEYLKEIGGFTCLHVALKRGLHHVLELLHHRNIGLYVGGRSDNYVNMAFPSLNPERHMNSPEKFVPEGDSYSRQFIDERKKEIEELDKDDASGDSSDEEAPAYFHKQSLMSLAKLVAETDELADEEHDLEFLNKNLEEQPLSLEERQKLEILKQKTAIVHFHGVPFMKGQYTNDQRRSVGKKIHEINASSTELDRDKQKKMERFKAIHSRTSTTTVGLQTLYDIMKCSQEQQEKLEEVDKKLRLALAHLWMENPDALMRKGSKKKKIEGGALWAYIYKFKDNPIKLFWSAFTPNSLPGVVRYRFPIVSFSKASDHAVNFGIGKNVENLRRGEERIDPNYHEGKPHHRLVGLVYVTLHSISKIHQLQNRCVMADTLQLRSSNQLESSSPLIIDHQIEVLFFGGVAGEYVKSIIPIIYPNLKKPFKPGYHDVIWGLKETQMSSSIGWSADQLQHAYVNFVHKVVKAIARREKQIVCNINEKNEVKAYSLAEKNTNLSPAQESISAGNAIKKGSGGSAGLIKITSDQLIQPKLATQQASSEEVAQDVSRRASQIQKSLTFESSDTEEQSY